MSISGFEYAQARLQARHGARPDGVTWRRLHASASLEHFLEACGRSGLSPWVAELHPDQSPQRVERALAGAFRRHAEEVASWLPPPWQPAVRWSGELPFPGGRDGDTDAWRASWPHASPDRRAALGALTALLDEHRERMQSANLEEDGWGLRDELDQKLSRLFRRHTREPVAALCHLALTALDLERLRGAVLRRLLFSDVESEASWV